MTFKIINNDLCSITLNSDDKSLIQLFKTWGEKVSSGIFYYSKDIKKTLTAKHNNTYYKLYGCIPISVSHIDDMVFINISFDFLSQAQDGFIKDAF